MRISLVLAIAGTITALAPAANAQSPDQRSFFHPLGFWSNEGVVPQQKIYPPIRNMPSHYASPEWEWYGSGGGLLFERNK